MTPFGASVPVLQLLGLYAAVYSLTFHAGELYKATGKAHILVWLSLAKLVTFAPVLWFAAGRSITAVAAAVLALNVAFGLVRATIVRRHLGIGVGAQLRPVAAPIVAGLAMWCAVVLRRQRAALVGHLVRLVLLGVLGLALYRRRARRARPHGLVPAARAHRLGAGPGHERARGSAGRPGRARRPSPRALATVAVRGVRASSLARAVGSAVDARPTCPTARAVAPWWRRSRRPRGRRRSWTRCPGRARGPARTGLGPVGRPPSGGGAPGRGPSGPRGGGLLPLRRHLRQPHPPRARGAAATRCGGSPPRRAPGGVRRSRLARLGNYLPRVGHRFLDGRAVLLHAASGGALTWPGADVTGAPHVGPPRCDAQR